MNVRGWCLGLTGWRTNHGTGRLLFRDFSRCCLLKTRKHSLSIPFALFNRVNCLRGASDVAECYEGSMYKN